MLAKEWMGSFSIPCLSLNRSCRSQRTGAKLAKHELAASGSLGAGILFGVERLGAHSSSSWNQWPECQHRRNKEREVMDTLASD